MPRKTGKSQLSSKTIESKLLDALSAINRPAEFFTYGQFPSALPGLHVDGFGEVGLPLSATEAKRLIKRCKQAPYGKGTKTVVDTTVRKVWELDPDSFSLKNPKWETAINSILRQIEERLGLTTKSLGAHLYKLLVYEKGSFFLPHRDGEKLDEMVATLVINLPSKHSGGELVIHHQGQTESVAMPNAAAGLEAEFVAFYADCQHEVKPLLSGYRLCFIYNLALEKLRAKKKITAPNFHNVTEQIANLFLNWDNPTNQEDVPTKLALMLDHRYTKSGLSIDKLKGVDLAKASVLFDAADLAGCDAYLALVTLWQSGSADGDFDNYGYGSSRYYSRTEEDEDEGDSPSSSNYTMGEIYDHSLTASHWSDRNGIEVAFGKIPLDQDEIVSENELTETAPSREDYEGYTGNAGMTLERWYHRAAIILWPRIHRFQVWCDAGTDAAISGLNHLLKNSSKTKRGQEERLVECRQFIERIIETWSPAHSGYSWDPSEPDDKPQNSRDRSSFWTSLTKLNDQQLARRTIEEVMSNDPNISFSQNAIKWFTKQGWADFAEPILSMMSKTTKETLGRNLVAFRQIAISLKPSDDQNAFIDQLARIVIDAIERIDSSQQDSWNAPRLDRIKVIVDLTLSLLALDDEKRLSRFLAWLNIHPRYELTEVMIPAVIQLFPKHAESARGNLPISGWVGGIIQELRSRTATAPSKPTNWKRDSEIPDCPCADCMRLSAFLADPTLPEARFPLAKHRRQHLHGIIDRHNLDCTHDTLRVARPQILVCKKTIASYIRACETYEQDLKNLQKIEEIESA